MPSRPANQLRATEHLRLVPPAGGTMAAVSAARAAKAASLAAVNAAAVAAAKTPAAPTPATSAALKARSLGDWLLNGIGVGAATASAGFATYALIFSTGEVVPSGNFNLFARYDRLYNGPTLRTGTAGTPPAGAPMAVDPTGQAPPPDRTETASRDVVDFMPTGSVSGVAGLSTAVHDRAPARRSAPSLADAATRTLPGFTLRDVFDGKALVESKSALAVVKLGSVIEGAGEVLSIEKQGDRWVVRTANGVIAGQRR